MNKFNLLKSIQNDYILMLSVIFCFISIGLYWAINYFDFIPNFHHLLSPVLRKEDNVTFFLLFTIVCNVTFIPVFFLRVVHIIAIFKKGTPMIGKITYCEFFRDRGRIEVSFENNNIISKKGIPIMKNKQTNMFQSGQTVQIIVSHDKKSILIPELYC